MKLSSKMIAKISGGNGLRGALDYDFAPCKKTGKPRAELICGTLQGTPRQMCRQAAPLRALRQVSKPIWRCSLNADPQDGILTPEKWTEIVHDFLKGMGLNPATAAWACVRHTDHHDEENGQKGRDHCHLSVLRVQPDGSLFKNENDVFRAKKVTEQLEIKHQLTHHSRERVERRAPSIAQNSAKQRTGKMSSKEQIQNYVDQFFNQETDLSFENLKQKLLSKGVEIRDSKTQKGRLQGFSYCDLASGVAVPGSKLGTDYSLGLLARGLQYTTQTDQPLPQVAPITAQPLPAKNDRIPAHLRSFITPRQYSAEQIKPLATPRYELDTSKFNGEVANLQVGLASKAMLLIGSLLAEVSVFLAEKIIAFLKRLMAFFGLGMRPTAVQKYEHPEQPQLALTYEPTQINQLRVDKSTLDVAAEELFCVAQSLEKNDPSLLPILDDPELLKARAEVAEAMKNESAGASAAATADVDDFGFTEADFEAPAPTISPVAAQTDALLDLKNAIAANEIAAAAVKQAQALRPGARIYFDSRPKRQEELKQVQEELVNAKKELHAWRAAHPLKARINSKFSPELQEINQKVQRLEEAEKRAMEELKKAEIADENEEIFYQKLPKGVVPAATLAALEEARTAIKTARERLQIEASEMIEELKLDKMLGQKLDEISKNIEGSYKNFVAVGVVSTGDFDILAAKIQKLRNFKAQADAIKSSNADADEHKG